MLCLAAPAAFPRLALIRATISEPAQRRGRRSAARHRRERWAEHGGVPLLPEDRAVGRAPVRIVVQDYGKGADLEAAIRKAMAEAGKAAGVETAETKVGGFSAYAITDHSQGQPTTLVTVVVSPGRLVLGQGANVEQPDALKLLARVDFAKVAAAQ